MLCLERLEGTHPGELRQQLYRQAASCQVGNTMRAQPAVCFGVVESSQVLRVSRDAWFGATTVPQCHSASQPASGGLVTACQLESIGQAGVIATHKYKFE